VGLQLAGSADPETAAAASVDFADQHFGQRSPLLVPRDFSAGFIPELLDLDQLFLDTEFRVDPSGERLARLLSFPRSHGDAIVLDDVDGYPLDLLFDDALLGDEIAAVPNDISDAWGLGPLGSGLLTGNGVRFDDFPGDDGGQNPPPAIPEPSTAALFALGLLALALRRR
jgi:hypothetical protein